MKYLVAACLLTLCAVAVAQTVTQPAQPGAVDSERQRISAERGKLEAEFSAEHASCYKKFAVNNCLGDVNEKRREAMAHLRRQEILLNDQERKQKAAEQLRKIEEKSSVQKQQEDADHRAEALSGYQSRLAKEKQKEAARVSLQSREQANTEARTSRLLGNQQKAQTRAARTTAEAEETRKFDERQKEAQNRRAQHESEKLKRVNPPARSLPLPE